MVTKRIRKFIADNEALVVSGSINSNADDQYMKRSDVRPLQIIDVDGIRPIVYFNNWGVYGISSLAWQATNPYKLYISTGNDLAEVDLISQQVNRYNIHKLKDVHEITMINNLLWLANTAYDEAIAFDIAEKTVVKRISLRNYKQHDARTDGHTKEQNADVVDKYHLNQIFEGFEGQLYALVHHISGKQIMRKIANKILKSQGDGGVINLINKKVIPLKLKAPHSVRKVDGNYWIFDSGNSQICIYSSDWNHLASIGSRGWCRGASISSNGMYFYAGVSETRRRYSHYLQGTSYVPNMIEFYSVLDRANLGYIQIPDVEQINNIYVISKNVADAMLKMGAGRKLEKANFNDTILQ